MSGEGPFNSFSEVRESLIEDVDPEEGEYLTSVDVGRLVLYMLGAIILGFAEGLAGLVSTALSQVERIIETIASDLELLVFRGVWSFVEPLEDGFIELQEFLGDFGLLAFPISIAVVVVVLWAMQVIVRTTRRMMP